MPITNGKTIFVGLDGEMTGSGRPEKYQLVQIGVAVDLHNGFRRDIGYQNYLWTDEALEVNHFTHERIQAGDSPERVDHDLELFLLKHGSQFRQIVTVGWNVGTFDLPFVERYLPRSWELLSYRSVDLNAASFTIAQAKGLNWKHLKDATMGYSDMLMRQFSTLQRHDAGYDALAALYEWEFLQLVIRGEARV